MRYVAYHGSPSAPFTRFDADRLGSQSQYDHAIAACFTSDPDVAATYAGPTGFVGRFAFDVDNVLDIPDDARDAGIAAFVRRAASEGYDALILRQCAHSAISPGQPSDIFYVFDLTRPRCIEVISEPEPSPVRYVGDDQRAASRRQPRRSAR